MGTNGNGNGKHSGVAVVDGCWMPGQILCKIQRPLFNSAGNYDRLYIYDEERMVDAEVSIPAGVLSELFPDEGHKGYAVCALVEDVDIPGGVKVSIEAIVDPLHWPEW